MSAGGVLAAAGLQLLADGPSDGRDLTPVTVSPGLGGFIAMFLLVVVTLLLILDMTRRIRRVNARARVEERHRLEDLEHAERAAGESDAERADGEAEGPRVDRADDDGVGGESVDDGPDRDPGEEPPIRG